jgi:DNA-binding response OmpR family regulator
LAHPVDVSDQPVPAVRVLVVDDEPPIVELVRGYLAREGWTVESAADGPAALELARTFAPDVVVLDVMLPGLDGVEVCRRLRSFSDAYVVMLTARSEEIDRIVGLSVGADDYLVKPFSPRELVARIKAMLRRPRAGTAGVVAGGSSRPVVAATPGPAGLEIDEPRHQVRVDGSAVELTATEFGILAALGREPGVVVSRSALLDRVWGAEFIGDDHLVDVHVANLRRKLGDDPATPRFVETVRAVGYRLVDR